MLRRAEAGMLAGLPAWAHAPSTTVPGPPKTDSHRLPHVGHHGPRRRQRPALVRLSMPPATGLEPATIGLGGRPVDCTKAARPPPPAGTQAPTSAGSARTRHSEFLPGRSKEGLVDVRVVGLAHGEH